MDDLERRLRDSFRDRAGDLETTPHLWDRVKDRIGAQQRRRWYATAAWAAAAAIVLLGAGIVVAQLVDRQADAPPVIDTSPEPTPMSGNVPPFVVASDGQDVAVLTTSTGEEVERLTGVLPGDQPVTGLAVAPGSTPRDLTVAFLFEGDAHAGFLTVRDGEGVRSELFGIARAEGTPDCAPDRPELTHERSGPVWSPDGRHVAWAAFCPGEEGGLTVWVVTWDDGDLAAGPSAVLEHGTDLEADGAVVPGRLELRDWAAGEGGGELRLVGGNENRHALYLPVSETAAGLAVGQLKGYTEGQFGNPVVDWRTTPPGDGPEAVEYALTLAGGPDAALEVRRRILGAPSDTWEVVTVPPHVWEGGGEPPGDGAPAVSMSVRRLAALLVSEGDLWVYDAEPQSFTAVPALALDGPVVAADFLGVADTDPPPQPTPTETAASPTPEPSPTAAPDAPGAALVTDGTSFAIARNGSTDDALYTLDEEGESTVVALAVRPGSTPDDLTAAVLTQAEGMYDLRQFRYVDGGASFEAFAEPYQLRDPTLDGPVPAPVWSPDGRHLAWLESSPDGPVLRTIGWDDGPGTGRTADDNADFLLDDAPAGAQPTLEEWAWRSAPDPEASGMIQAVDRELRLYTVDVTRQPDGALAVADTRVTEGAGPGGGALVDLADSHAAADETSARYLLTAVGSGEGDVDLRLTVVAADDQGDDLPVPDELTRTSDPSSVWMTAYGDGVLLGAGGRAWRVAVGTDTADPLEGTVWYADFVR